METFFLIIISGVAFWNYILRGMYKHRAEIFQEDLKRIKKHNRGENREINEAIICSNISVFQPERQN